MIEYKWSVLSLYCSKSENGLQNIVKRASWVCSAVDGQDSAKIYRDTEFPAPDQTNFTDYVDLTEEKVIEWIKSVTDLESLYDDLIQQMNFNKSDTGVAEKKLPWDFLDKYHTNDKYVMVKDNKVVFGPVHWASDLMNTNLQIHNLPANLPHDILARQMGILPINKPLIINDSVKIYKVLLLNEQSPESIFYDNGKINWDFSSGTAIGTYAIEEKTIEEIKANITERLITSGQRKELSKINVTLPSNSITCSVGTGYIYKSSLLVKLQTMNDTDMTPFRFTDGNLVKILKSDVIFIINEIEKYIESCLNAEYNAIQQISEAENIDELKTIYSSLSL